jgi:hypothetical protein
MAGHSTSPRPNGPLLRADERPTPDTAGRRLTADDHLFGINRLVRSGIVRGKPLA